MSPGERGTKSISHRGRRQHGGENVITLFPISFVAMLLFLASWRLERFSKVISKTRVVADPLFAKTVILSAAKNLHPFLRWESEKLLCGKETVGCPEIIGDVSLRST